MSDRPADRRWQFRLGEDWTDIVKLTQHFLWLASGAMFEWQDGFLPLPDMAGRLRYTVPVHGVWMEPRVPGRGGFVLLAQDMGREDLAEAIRAAQVEERRNRYVRA